MAHVLISAAHKSSGKTTVSLGLCAALAARGHKVQPFKKGPDYIDPMWLGAAAGRSCYTLDFFTMSAAEIEDRFAAAMVTADIGIIEGNKGLYDGLDLDGSNSNAALAARLGAPVVLVLDTRGMTRGIAPLILGYQDFDPNIRIAGVILNQVGGSRHEGKLRQVIEHYTDVPVIGAVARNPEMQILERHLGLVPSNELSAAQAHIRRIGALVAEQVDLEALISVAATASPPPTPTPGSDARPQGLIPGLRIGIARDPAFGFYYPADLEVFQAAGAELVPIDLTADHDLPDIDGLLIGGGFPESCVEALSQNESMRQAVREFIEHGGPAYAECGGLMYLCRSLTWGSRTGRMVGVFPLDVRMHDRPQGRGYVRLQETAAHPWPKLGAADGETVPAHEFHYSGLESFSAEAQVTAYRVKRGHGIDGVHDGMVYKNLLANYCHLRHTVENPWVWRFLRHVQACRAVTAAPAPQ